MTRLKTKARQKAVDTPGSWGVTVDGVDVLKDAALACAALAKDKVIGVDTETTGLSPWRSDIALIQLYGEQTGTLAVIQVPGGRVPEPVAALMARGRSKTFVVHNGVGFDMLFMDRAGLDWRRHGWHDTYVGETLLEAQGRRDIGKSLANSLRLRLGKEVDKEIEHGHWEAQELSLRQIEYAAQDVLSLPALYRNQLERANAHLETSALDMEMELVPVVVEMELTGLPCTPERMRAYVRKQAAAIVEAEARLRKRFGKSINLGSTQQLQRAFAKQGIPVTSTNKDTLIGLSQMGGKAGAIADDLMEWKHGNQRINMYSEEWMAENIVDDRIHPHFKQCAADTTRFTCSEPNLQQVPKDSRGDIIGGVPGLRIVSVDYSQIEVRIAAFIAGDRVLLDLLEKGGDIHTSVASVVFNVKPSKVTPQMRKLAKAMTFLLLFGGGVTMFYEYVKMRGGDIDYAEAEAYVRMFFSTFTGLRAMKERAEQEAARPGVVSIRLPNGSRRVLAGWNKKSTTILNTMVQGSAAVGIKAGMLEAHRRGLVRGLLGGQVHDELVAAVPRRQAREYSEELRRAMVDGMSGVLPGMPVEAEAKIGEEWQA